jgi:hypothetical protein
MDNNRSNPEYIRNVIIRDYSAQYPYSLSNVIFHKYDENDLVRQMKSDQFICCNDFIISDKVSEYIVGFRNFLLRNNFGETFKEIKCEFDIFRLCRTGQYKCNCYAFVYTKECLWMHPIISMFLAKLCKKEFFDNIIDIDKIKNYKTCQKLICQYLSIEFVYIIYNPKTGLHKIGRTDRDISVRNKELVRKYGDQLEMINYIETYDSRALEKKLHKQFASKRKDGEWFDLNQEDLNLINQTYN